MGNSPINGTDADGGWFGRGKRTKYRDNQGKVHRPYAAKKRSNPRTKGLGHIRNQQGSFGLNQITGQDVLDQMFSGVYAAEQALDDPVDAPMIRAEDQAEFINFLKWEQSVINLRTVMSEQKGLIAQQQARNESKLALASLGGKAFASSMVGGVAGSGGGNGVQKPAKKITVEIVDRGFISTTYSGGKEAYPKNVHYYEIEMKPVQSSDQSRGPVNRALQLRAEYKNPFRWDGKDYETRMKINGWVKINGNKVYNIEEDEITNNRIRYNVNFAQPGKYTLEFKLRKNMSAHIAIRIIWEKPFLVTYYQADGTKTYKYMKSNDVKRLKKENRKVKLKFAKKWLDILN